jgi:hypothetical protein
MRKLANVFRTGYRREREFDVTATYETPPVVVPEAPPAQDEPQPHHATIDLLRAHIDGKVAILSAEIDALRARIDANPPVRYLPHPPFFHVTDPGMFMPYSNCVSADFFHPRFDEICQAIHHPFMMHRKVWEWVYIIHQLQSSGILQPGARGLVFGVGSERLPAYFAKLGAQIVATDAPEEIGEANGWKATGQYSAALSNLRYEDVVEGDVFDRLVSYEQCDMNNISEHLTGFDFNWSSCCFEHLGDLEAGIQFVINAVEKTLRVGGIAVHTTEYNLSSNDETLDTGPTVIYRRRDIEELIRRLRDRGHEVEELRIAPDMHPLDFHVDMPPYSHNPHLRLMLDRYVATSLGIVVRRGA